MKYLFFLILLVKFISTPALSWVDHQGKTYPNSDDRKDISGFGAYLVVTPDQKWREKWETAPNETPALETADKVKYGQTLSIILFFANPLLNSSGEIKLSCDVQVKRPNGTFSINQKNIDCGVGKLQGAVTNIRTSLSLQFNGEPKDPPGKWMVSISISDNIRKVSIPLKTSFNLSK